MQKNNQYRITQHSKSGKKTVTMFSEKELQVFRANRLKEIRKNDLGLTQKDLANAVGVNLRTLQDWELGRSSMPKPVEILMNLMKKMPKVKETLLTDAL